MKLPLTLFVLAMVLFIAAVVLFFAGIELPGYLCIATGCTLLFIWVAVVSMRIGKTGGEE